VRGLTKNSQTVVLALGAVLVVGFLLRRQAADAVAAVANINEGTPFEGGGVIGTLGNVTNVASGGILGRIGSGIGEFVSGIFDNRSIDELTGG